MPGKKKKGNKKEKKLKDTDSLTAVDRAFYEITIQDLNNKLSRLRVHNAKVEELNENLTEKIKILEEDKTNIVAHLNRQLAEKSDIINEMNERLTELSNVREQENIEAKNKIKELDLKCKAINDQLTSEIKLLNGKLNSLEEFRIQRDDILAKFDEQETILKEHQRNHKIIIKDLEQKAIVQKEDLKKEIKMKLLELSKQFSMLTQVRVTDTTRNLYTENITLSKEIDKVIQMYKQIEKKCAELEVNNNEMKKYFQNSDVEKNNLIKSCQEQIKIIQNLTVKCEQLKNDNMKLRRYKDLYETSIKKEICEQFSYNEMNKKLRIMGQRIEMIKRDKSKLITIHLQLENEIIKLRNILKKIKIMVLAAIAKYQEEGDEVKEESSLITVTDEYRKILQRMYRENLLSEIMKVLVDYVDDTSMVPFLIPSPESIYRPGTVGFTPKSGASLLELFKKEARKVVSTELMFSENLKTKTPSDQIMPTERIIKEENIFDVDTMYLKGFLPTITSKGNKISDSSAAKSSTTTTTKRAMKDVIQRSIIKSIKKDAGGLDDDQENNKFAEVEDENDEDEIQFIY